LCHIVFFIMVHPALLLMTALFNTFEPVMGEIQVHSQVKRKIYRGRGWLTGRILGR
jgi:hypothetical protein